MILLYEHLPTSLLHNTFVGHFRLHPNNVIGVRAFGDQFMCASLVEACSKHIQKYFVDVARSEEFLSLDLNDVVEILSNDELHVSSEEQVHHVMT